MGQEDSPLSDRGRVQASAVAARLATEDFTTIYTSDLGRAAATAEVVAAASGIPANPDKRLRERHAGILQGVLEQEAGARYPALFEDLTNPDPDLAIPGGESARQVQQRIAPLLDEILQRHPNQTVALVTHGGVIRTLLWYLLDTAFSSARRAKVDNTSLSTFLREAGCWTLATWNDTAHLHQG